MSTVHERRTSEAIAEQISEEHREERFSSDELAAELERLKRDETAERRRQEELDLARFD